MAEGAHDPVIWVNWDNEVVSFHEAPGFERLPFSTHSTMQANLQILLSHGFVFQ